MMRDLKAYGLMGDWADRTEIWLREFADDKSITLKQNT